MKKLWKDVRFEFRSIFSQLLLYFMLLVLPIIILGVVLFSWNKDVIRTEIENNAQGNISFLRQTMESEVVRIKELQYQLSNDQKLIRLIYRYGNIPAYDYYPLISDVMQILQIMKESNSFIEDVALYLPQIGKSISIKRGYVELDQNEYAQLLKQSHNTHMLVISDSTGIYSSVMYPPYIASEEENKIQFLFIVRLSDNSIEKFLAKYNQSEVSNTALYSFSAERWIFSTGNILENANGAQLGAITGSRGKSLDANARIDGKNYFVISEYSATLDLSFVQYIPMSDILLIPTRFEYFLWIYALLSMIVFVIYSYMVYRLVKKPVSKIVESFRALGYGDLKVKIGDGNKSGTSSEFKYLYDEFNRMMDYLNSLIDSNYKQRILSQKAELKQLQLHINPHFLYNTYYMLHRMIMDDDKENALALSSYVGTYFQYITRNMSDEIELEKEVDHARSYAAIQQMRFDGRMSIEFENIPEGYGSLMVPKMIIQPILENAIEHGLYKTTKLGRLKVEFSSSEDEMNIIIEDSGEKMTDEQIEKLREKLNASEQNMEITGMVNVHRRLVLKFGEKSGISVSRSELGGLKVMITIIPDKKTPSEGQAMN
jgi:two-component system sensor histidine kinase YesM